MTRTMTRTTTETIPERVQKLVDENPDIREVRMELVRLNIEMARLQSELSQELAKSSDVDGLVDLIESGNELSPTDSADRIKILKDQCEAYRLAICRAERRRTDILKTIEKEFCGEFAAEHRLKIGALLETMASLSDQVDDLSTIPNVLRGNGLGGDPSVFPLWHHAEMMRVKKQLQYFGHNYQLFLNGDSQ